MCELFGMTEHTTIALLRKELGMTLDEFAVAVGISSKGYLSQIERGVIDCSLSIALKIEEFSEGRIDAAVLSRDVRMARLACPGGCPVGLPERDTSETDQSSSGTSEQISPAYLEVNSVAGEVGARLAAEGAACGTSAAPEGSV